MGHRHPGLGNDLLHLPDHPVDGVHLVMEEIDLTPPFEFPQHRLPDQGLVPLADKGLDRQPPDRGGGDNGQVPHPRQGHIQGTGNGGGGEGQHIHLGPQLLEPFLMADPETMLLVDDRQSQAFEIHIPLEQLVGADQDIHPARGHLLQDPLHLFLGAEAGEHLHLHRPVGETVLEVLVVLLGQQGGGYQHRHLLAVLYRHKGRPHGHLGLAEAHIAAHQPVHGPGGAHIRQHRLDGRTLVMGLLEGKGGGKGLVVGRRQGKGMAGTGLAAGIDIQQFGGRIPYPLLGLALGLDPLLRAQLVQGCALGAGIAGQQMQGRHRYIELAPFGILQHHEFGIHAGRRQPLQAPVAAYPVILVDHRGPQGQIGEVADHRLGVPGRGAAPAGLADPLCIKLPLGDHRQRRLLQQQSLLQGRHGDGKILLPVQKGLPACQRPGAQPIAVQGLQQHLPPSGALGGQQHLAGEIRQKAAQPGGGLFGPGSQGQVRQGAGGVVDALAIALGYLHPGTVL